jgi:hypothetical protein
MSEQDKKHEKTAPLETLKDGAVTVKLWNQRGDRGQRYVNFSIGKLYKDEQTGQWKESRSFNSADLAKLQKIIPQALEAAHMHEVALNAQLLEAARKWKQEREGGPEVQPGGTSQIDMAAHRDEIMRAAYEKGRQDQALEQTKAHTPTHAPQRQPGRDRSR